MKNPNDLIKIPDEKKIRVIIDTDAACEADDPFAIAQALMSPKLIVKGILAEHFREPDSTQRSYDEIRTVLDAMEIDVPVFMGQNGPLEADSSVSPAAQFIIDEATGAGTGPLYILCQGAITNVAMALRTCPQLKEKIIIVWIGTHGIQNIGKPVPFREFNAGNDVTAANEVLQSGAKIWLIPSDVYTTINVSLAELKMKVEPYGKIGHHLYHNMIDYNLSDRASWTQGESWSLGDSPAIAVAINPGCGKFVEAPAPFVNEETGSESRADSPVIRVYTSVDSRFILEDFFAKLKLFFGE
ncbi:MAG: nucleoside hydrolase [Treponema sp.]|nr:nucleoside hydrolase [Treponema sp.]